MYVANVQYRCEFCSLSVYLLEVRLLLTHILLASGEVTPNHALSHHFVICSCNLITSHTRRIPTTPFVKDAADRMLIRDNNILIIDMYVQIFDVASRSYCDEWLASILS